MASFYCQELIRNSRTLCNSYIERLTEFDQQAKQRQSNVHDGAMEDEIAKEWLFGKTATYYVEEN